MRDISGWSWPVAVCSLLMSLAPARALALGDLPEPSFDESAETSVKLKEGLITGLNLEIEPPLIRIAMEAGETLVMLMNGRNTGVWINQKLRRIYDLKLGDRIKFYYVVHDNKGLVTSIEVTARAPKPKNEDENLIDTLKGLQKHPPRPASPPIVGATPQTAPPSATPAGQVPVTAPPFVRPMAPGMTTTTQERRQVR